jgi:hypothetical protein
MKNYRFKKEEILNYLDEFYSIYSDRPIIDNSGGMKSSHLFPLFFYLKKMKPKLIIESGVYKGQGTWMMRKCCPESKIISIDLDLTQIIYKDDKTMYHNRDISEIDLKVYLENFNPEEVLVFFDDHQDFNKRIDFLTKNKIKNVIYEDNYPFDQGDCISPKKIIGSGDFYVNSKKYILEESEKNFIRSKILHYEEFPPIFRDDKTRWGNDWTYETRESLLNKDLSNKYSNFYSERFDYTWICYLEIENN